MLKLHFVFIEILKFKSKFFFFLNKCIGALLKVDHALVIKTDSHQHNFSNFKFHKLNIPFWYNFKNTLCHSHPIEFIKNGKIIGNGAVLSADGKVKLESTTFQIEYLNLLRVNHKIFFHRLLRYQKIGKVIVLAHPGLTNYYHWTIETLPRLTQIDNNEIINSKILINKNAPQFVKDSLRLVYGISEKQLLYSNVHTNYKSSNVIIPPFTHERNEKTNWSNISNPSILTVTKKLVLEKVGILNLNKFSHVFISRKKANQRRIINEDALMVKLAPLGFEKIYCEDLSFEQQIDLFRNVRVVISTHGAALSNLLFAPEKSLLIELFPRNRYIRDGLCFGQICENFNHYHVFIGYESKNITQDFEIDEETIELINNEIKSHEFS